MSRLTTTQTPWPGGAIVRFLLKISLLGTEMKLFPAAKDIIDSVVDLRPDLPQPRLSAAHLVARMISPAQSRRVMVQLLQDFPDFQMGVAMLALGDREARISGWQALARSVIEDGRDESAMRLAEYVLGIEREPRQAPSVPSAPAAGPSSGAMYV
jgi:Bacterial type III secretion protein (HrpB1_HrpK)